MAGCSPELAEAILGSLSSGVIAVDDRGVLAMMNAGAQRILGCPDGDVDGAIGRECRRVFQAQPTVARLLLETLHGRDPLVRAELVLEQIDGCQPNTIGFTLSPMRNRQGRVQGAAMLFRDLTPLERSDEQERLRERLAALGQMAAGMAHEIRNPLAGMEVLAGLLKRRLVDRPEEQALVTELTGELRELADTVTASLDFVKPLSLERGPVDPVALIEEALTTATLDAGPGREVVISVRDDGPGVSEELQEKVFYPFFTTKQQGSGVGLAMAQKVVASHGGVIELDAAEGGGCTFRIRLPDRGGES
jgi:nitrogen-specific signal transduction histidine kinase